MKSTQYGGRRSLEAVRRDRLAVQRKWLGAIAEGRSPKKEELVGALASFKDRLQTTRFAGIVLDYDGTVVDSIERASGPGGSMTAALTTLCQSGVLVGIATGRGKSVREDLWRRLPQPLWEMVCVGYYNGGVIGSLADPTLPTGSEEVDASLFDASRFIEASHTIRRIGKVTRRRPQITIEATGTMSDAELFRAVERAVEPCIQAPRLVRSSHSVDVLAAGVSKLNLVEHMERMLAPNAKVLCVGDCGRWPGNDYELLTQPYSLSVGEVSGELETCWNLASADLNGPQALLEYVNWTRLEPRLGSFMMEIR